MRAWTQVKVTRLIELLGLTAGALFCCLQGQGQQAEAHFSGRVGIGSTVSVVSLRIPVNAWRHFERAKALAERHRLAESDVESGKAIAIAPDFAAAYLLRASAQVRERSFEAAVASIAEARRIEPDAEWAGVLLAGAYNGLHRYNEAMAVLDGLHGGEGQSWQATYERARAAIGLLDAKAAMQWSDAALAAAPQSFNDAQLLRANALVLAARWEEAASQMEAYLQSSAPQEHRAEVLAVLPKMKERTREEELKRLALR